MSETPEEKAKELVSNMIPHQWHKLKSGDAPSIYKQSAKQCALIIVDEMLSLGSMVGSDLSDSFYIYWQQVKKEIEKL